MNARGQIDELRFVDPLARKLDLSGAGRVPESSSAYVRGWAFLTDPPRPAAAAVATIDDGPPTELVYHQPRPDLVMEPGVRPRLPVGFHGVISLRGLSLGRHVLRIALVDGTQSPAPVGAPAEFEIVDGAFAFPATEQIGPEQMRVAVDLFSASCNGEVTPAQEAPVGPAAILTLLGWAVDRRFGTAASDVYACLNGGTFVRGIIGTLRTDVAGSLGMQTVARCGYVVRIDAASLRAGDHRVDVRAIAADGDRYGVSDAFAFSVRSE